MLTLCGTLLPVCFFPVICWRLCSYYLRCTRLLINEVLSSIASPSCSHVLYGLSFFQVCPRVVSFFPPKFYERSHQSGLVKKVLVAIMHDTASETSHQDDVIPERDMGKPYPANSQHRRSRGAPWVNHPESFLQLLLTRRTCSRCRTTKGCDVAGSTSNYSHDPYRWGETPVPTKALASA